MLRERGGNERIPHLSWTSDASDPLDDEASLLLYMGIWNTPLWCQNLCSSWHNAATLVQIHLSYCLQDKLGVYHHI